MNYVIDTDGKWLVTSEYGRVLVEPSEEFETRRSEVAQELLLQEQARVANSPNNVLLSELETATTLAQLKAALIKRFGG